MTTHAIQLSARKRFHKPMRKFLRTQGSFVKSTFIYDAWMREHPRFAPNSSKAMRLALLGRILVDLLQMYSNHGKTGGCKNGAVFINTYSQKCGINIADVAKEVVGG